MGHVRENNWRRELDLLTNCHTGWFDTIRKHSTVRWGEPIDEGAINSARTLLERLGDDLINKHPCSIFGQPNDGSVHIEWWKKYEPRLKHLSLYIAAGYVSDAIGDYLGTGLQFDIDKSEISLQEGEAIAREWLQRE
jgi:hypothetical protein